MERRPLLLGLGWHPDQLGGLNRYFKELLAALASPAPAPRAVVVGPAQNAPPDVAMASRHDAPMPFRMWRFAREARRLAETTSIVDAHFALYAFGPVVLGSLRRRPLVVHFHGPWAEESRSEGQTSRRVLAAKAWIEREVYRRAARVIVLSEAFGRLLVDRYGVAPSRVDVVRPGVDLKRFAPGDAADTRRRLASR